MEQYENEPSKCLLQADDMQPMKNNSSNKYNERKYRHNNYVNQEHERIIASNNNDTRSYSVHFILLLDMHSI